MIVNLSSTGDFIFQDNGTTFFTVSDTGTMVVDPTTAGTIIDFELATQWTTGDLINIDWASATTASGAATALDMDFTNFTPDDASAFYGVHLNDQASATASTEYGIYIEGSNWDRALYVEDVSEFREDVIFEDATDGVDIVVGSDNAAPIDIGADVFNGGKFIDISYDTAEVVDSALTGLDINFSTNLTGNAADDVTGVSMQLPGFLGNLPNAASTTVLTGANFSGAGIDTGTNGASVVSVNWHGLTVTLPDIDTGSVDDTVQSVGFLVNGGAVTNGAGTEDEIGIDVSGTKIDLDADNDTSLIASTDDRIDWELGGTAQTVIMSAPAAASGGATRSILDINYATPADGSGTNTHQGLTIDMDIGNATAGTNSVNGLAIEAIAGDAEVANVHGIDIGSLTGTAAANETAIQIGSGWDAEISFADTAQADIRIVNSSSLAFQDASGNEILSLEDVDNSANHVITIDADTALSFNSSNNSDTDITTISGEDLRIEPGGAGDLLLVVDADSTITISADAAPGIDMVSLTNAAFPTTTNDVNALSVSYEVTNASTNAVVIDSTFTGGATDLLTYTALAIADINPTNAAGADTVVGFDVSPVTDPGATITSLGVRIGNGWDVNLTLDDATTIVDLADAATLTFRDKTNTLLTLTDSGTTGDLAVSGDMAVNGGDLTTSATTFNLLNSTATTINFGGGTTSALNIADAAITGTIDIGGVSNDGASTVHIATNGTTGDTIELGNTSVNTKITITSGDVIDLEGTVHIDLTTIGATQYALCHTNSDTNDEPIGDCSGAPTADYAEQYPMAAGIEYGDIVVPGTREVVTQDGDTVVELVKSSQAYQGPVVGIVSNNYGDFTSAGYNISPQDNPMPVALVGRVPVKVVAEGGSIIAGDYLTTSSTPGAAMKATKVGRVIGMALEDWDGLSATVMVQVNNSWSMGDVLGTDGTSTLVTDNVIVSSIDTANEQTPSFDSYGLALRGSVWNGSEATAVEMMLQNVVDDDGEYRLSVRNTVQTEVAYITHEGTMRIAGNMVVGGQLFPSDRGVPQTEKYIYYDGSEGVGGDFMRTNAKGWSTGSYDFAQMFSSDEELVSGDVVAFSGNGETVQRSTGTDGEQLAGIVSTRPGFLAGENVEGAYPIALAGRVPTKVNLENGVIAVGDPLTVSLTAGEAMKAIDSGQIVGYALEAFAGSESDNLILTYVNVGYWSGGPQTITIVENRASEAPSGTQSYSALNMSGNIFMANNQILSIGRLEGVSGLWSVEPDGTIKTQGSVKTVTQSYQGTPVETIAVTSPESVITLTGTATLVEGQAEIRFEDIVPEFNDVVSAIAPIRVLVTPSGPVSLYVLEKDQNHFIVERFVGSADVEFDWMVTGYRKGYEPASPVISSETTMSDEQSEESNRSGVEGSPSESEQIGDPSIDELQDDIGTDEVAEEDPAPPESPDEPLIDSAMEDGSALLTEELSES